METKSIMIVGVGGQGTLLASRILGSVLGTAGYEVKVSEVHGMSQRGGSVVTYIRYGEKVYSPVIEKGQADMIVSFEQLGSRTLCIIPQKRRYNNHKYTEDKPYARYHGCG